MLPVTVASTPSSRSSSPSHTSWISAAATLPMRLAASTSAKTLFISPPGVRFEFVSDSTSGAQLFLEPGEGGGRPFAIVLEGAVAVVGIDTRLAAGDRAVLQHEIDVADRRK